jgi:hypothetical protein
MYMFCGPFLNISVLLYACWYMDSFGWGKTRKVIAESEEEVQNPTQNSNQVHALEQPKSTPIQIPQPVAVQPVAVATPRS